jgi:hypothetical protein
MEVLSVSGTGYTYQWTDSNGAVVADSIYGATTVPGIYTLTVFNTLNNCSATDFITVNIDTLLPITSAGADTSLNCSTLNTGVPVNGTGSQTGMTYLWSTSNGNIVAGGTSNFALVNAPGTYTLTVTNPANGCVNTDDVVVVIDTIKPIANAGADMVLNCYNPTVNLDGTASSARW